MSEGTLNRSRKGSAALAETKDLPLDRVNGTPIAIDGETAIVGKLGINQITGLAREVLSASIRMTPEERRRLITEAADMGNVATLLMVLDPKTVARLFSIILDKPEEWCGEQIGAIEALDIVDAVLENNDWEKLKAAFLRLRNRFQRSPTNSASLSPASPDSATPSETSESTPSNGSSE